MHQGLELSGLRALVTGGTRGIGSAVVEALATEGARVVCVARSHTDVAQRTAAWTAAGWSVHGATADVAAADDRARLVADALAWLGGLDVLVNNAGTNVRRRAQDYTVQERDLVLETNLIAPFELSRLCHEHLARSPKAAIVNVGSVAGHTSLGTGAPYAMSKAGLAQLTRTLACEWAAQGIRVNCVAPWYIDTPLASTVLSDPTYHDAVLARTPLRRIGRAEEVAAAVAFLASPRAAYITGQCLSVDGGFSVYGFDPQAHTG